MYYCTIKDINGNEKGYLFDRLEHMHRLTFNPNTEVLAFIEFKVKGRTYEEQKESVRQTAIQMQKAEAPGLFWSDLMEIADWFRAKGRRYGLIEEFEENGIL